MSGTEGYTDDELVNGVRLAVAAADFPAVEAIMRRLAVQNPRLASEVLDTLHVGIALAGGPA